MFLLIGMMLRALASLLLFIGLFPGSLVFPPLAVVAVIAAIYRILSRIAYLLEHLPIVLRGSAYYGLAALADAHLPRALGSIFTLLSSLTGPDAAWYGV